MTNYADIFAAASFLVIIVIALVTWLYLRRQAVALEAVNDSVQRGVEMMVKDRRQKRQAEIGDIDLMPWAAAQLDVLNKQPGAFQFSRIERILPDLQSAELITPDNRRVIVSALDHKMLLARSTPRGKKTGGDAAARLAAFADRPLLGKKPNAVEVQRITLVDNEWLDMEAAVVGARHGINWGSPERLWFYVIEPEQA